MSIFKYLILSFFFASPFAAASLIYIPTKLNKKTAKIVVVIHGCLQSAESMSLGTGWNRLADQHNLAVLYPQVPDNSNPLSCWGWYLPENQKADSGQLKFVFDEIRSVKQHYNLGKSETFVVGISSGGATAAGLLACFPNEFKAGAIHSGPSYGLAQTLEAGESVLKEGPQKVDGNKVCNPRQFSGSILNLFGSADTVVSPTHAQRIISDFIGNTEVVTIKENLANSFKYSIADYRSKDSRLGRSILVQGLGHAWFGFSGNLRHESLLGPKAKIPTQLPFFTDDGPNSTQLIWEFFKEVLETSQNSNSK